MKISSMVIMVGTVLDGEDNWYSSTVVAPSMCEQLFDGIEILQKVVQDEACELLFLLARSSLFFFLYNHLWR